MGTDIRINKAQMSNITQSDESLGFWLGNLGKKALANVAIPFDKHNLPVYVKIFLLACSVFIIIEYVYHVMSKYSCS